MGEVVVTTLNPDYPLIRFATGDLSAVLPGASPCGRTNMRIKGWMGRADQTTKIKGMFVRPEQVAALGRAPCRDRARPRHRRPRRRDGRDDGADRNRGRRRRRLCSDSVVGYAEAEGQGRACGARAACPTTAR